MMNGLGQGAPAGQGEELAWGEMHSILTGEDVGFVDKKDALLRTCRLQDTTSSEEMVRAVALVFQSVSPDYLSGQELLQRPRHLDLAQEVLRRDAVNKIILGLSGPFRQMQATQSSPSLFILHSASALVGITQCFQLTPAELNTLLEALHFSLQVLDGWMDQSMNAGGGGTSAGTTYTLAGAPATQHLRFPTGTPGALLEDVAYLLSLSVVNALRVPQSETYALWARDSKVACTTNALLAHAGTVEMLTHLCYRADNAQHSSSHYVLNKIEQVGRGDRRSREEAAGYYGIVLTGVSGFLMSHAEAETREVGAIALQMCCGSIVQMGVGSRVLARYKWKGSVFARGTVRAVRNDGTLVVRFDDGEEESVHRNYVKLESAHQLSGHGWARAREWFPSFFSCGLGTVVTEETLLQCLSVTMDFWLASTMCALVDELIPAEQEAFRVWEECVRQRDTPGYSTDPVNGSLYENYSDVPPTPECRILLDVLHAIAFTLNPDNASLLLSERLPVSWRGEMVSNILKYDKSDAIQNPRPGTAMFVRFVRKAHGSQGPIAWLIESSPGRQGDLCAPALSVLSAYLDLCTGLCVTNEAAFEVFSMMQADAEPRSTFHISSRYIITDPECSVMGGLAQRNDKPTAEADSFLKSALQLLSTMLLRSPLVKAAISQKPDLMQSCFERLFLLLEKPVGGAVIGQIFNTLAAWSDTHDTAAQMWHRIQQGNVLAIQQQPSRTHANGFGVARIEYGQGHVGQAGHQGQDAVQGGMEFEFQQERRNRRYPQTIGFLTLILQLLKTVNWRNTQQDVSLHTLAVHYVKWAMESVLLRWDEQRFDNMKEKWQIAFLLLGIVRAALLIPEPQTGAGYDQSTTRQRAAPSLLWWAINSKALLRKLMEMTTERRGRDNRIGMILDELLVECLATILAVLKHTRSARGDRKKVTSELNGKGLTQDVVDWDDGSLVMKLSSEEWHMITLRHSNPYIVSQLCLNILLQLVQERCRISHHFLASGRGRPEDITRDAEETLLETSKRAYAEMMKNPQAQAEAANLDKHVIRALEAGTRVSNIIPQLQHHLIPSMAKCGMQREAQGVQASLPAFENNKADMVQELMADILNLEVEEEESDTRRLLVCDILSESLSTDAWYYNLTHILCGVPERYVEGRTRVVGVSDHDVLRPFGSQRQTCVSVIAERLLENDNTFVKLNPVTASRFLKVLAALASDRVIGSAVLRYIRSVNLVDKLMGLLKERLSELPVQPSSFRDPTNIAREFGICASVLQLAALELFSNPDPSAQKHILKMLCTTREWHHPLLLEGIRSLDVDSLPAPPRVSELLTVPMQVVQEGDIPSYSIEALEEQLGGVPGTQEAVAMVQQANEALAVYPCVVDYVEKWCRLAEVTLVIVEAEAEAGNDRSITQEVDEVLFQTLLTLVNQMSINLSRSRSMPHSESVMDALLAKLRSKIDERLSRAALALVDAIHTRSQRGTSHRSAEQLVHLLRPLLQCLCDASDKDIRANLYTVLIALLHNVDDCPLDSSSQVDAEKLQVRRACQNELLRNPHALMQRLMADASDNSGYVTTAAWSTLAKIVEWDEEEQVSSELHSTNLIAQQLANYDGVLCELLKLASQGDSSGAFHLGAYQAYMSFLLAYANTVGGAKALVEQHAFMKHLAGRKLLSLCGDGFPSTIELLQERCAQVALPALRVVRALVQRLATDHSVIQQVHTLLDTHSRLFDFILRRPFSLRKAHDSLDVTSLQMLECSTQIISVYACSDEPYAKANAPALVHKYQLRSILAEFSSRSLWAHKVLADDGASVGDWTSATSEEATAAVTGVVFNVLQCLRHISDTCESGEPLFQLSVSDPDGVSTESVLSRVDVTVLLSCLKDLQRSTHHLTKTAAPSATPMQERAEGPNSILMSVLHHSIAEALLLLLHHVRLMNESQDPRCRASALQHVETVLKELSEYVRASFASSRQDRVTMQLISTIDTIAKSIGGALGIAVQTIAA